MARHRTTMTAQHSLNLNMGRPAETLARPALAILKADVETRRHLVYRSRAVHWATVYLDFKPIWQSGPFRDKRQAMHAAWSEMQRRIRGGTTP